ncbi:IS200/IS605 family accessory protein TnpB-related protein [Ectobacillus funiculus]
MSISTDEKDRQETPTEYQLQLTLPPVMQQDLLSHDDSLKKKKNVCKHLVFQHVSFNRGQHEMIKGSSIKKKGTVHSALTYRFIQQDNKWYVCATVNQDTPKWITLERYGYIGVDFNADRVSVCEIDRNGNPVHWFSISTKMYDRSSGQIKASISDALKVVVELAKERQKPIVIEKLSFKQRKASLGERSKRYARMLSGFAYTAYKELMESKCKVAGIKLIPVNPAYTSQMGMMKFMKRYGMSSHESAACLIARKAFTSKRSPSKV